MRWLPDNNNSDLWYDMNVYDNAFSDDRFEMLAGVYVCVWEWVCYYSRFMKKLELEKDAQIEEQCRKEMRG